MDTEIIVKRILFTAIILLIAAFFIILIMHEQLQSDRTHTEMFTLYIFALSIFYVLDFSLLAYFCYTAMQPDILFTYLIVLVFVIIIMIYSPLICSAYYRFKRIRASALEPVPDSTLWKSKQICLLCGSEIPENTEYCPRCGRARAQCSVCKEDIFSEDLPVMCPHCRALSHRDHLAEWIREKGSCPKCGRKLKEMTMIGIAPKVKCLFCVGEMPENAEYCPHCGEARAKCSVCSEYIVPGDQFLKCSYCGALSHKDHLLEWIKVKGYCPNCEQKLKEKDIT